MNVMANNLKNLINCGAIAFKVFTIAAPPNRKSEFDGLCFTKEGEILDALRHAKKSNLITIFHAEDQNLLNYFKKYEDKELYKVKYSGHSKFLCTTNVKTTKYDGDLFTPLTTAINYPCFCLHLGLEQITINTLLLLIIRQLSHLFFTEDLTFIFLFKK